MSVLSSYNLESQNAFQQRLFWAALRAMQLGVRIDPIARAEISDELSKAQTSTMEWITTVLGHQINLRSSKQMLGLYYGDLAQKVVMTRAKPGQPPHPTTDDEALDTISKREPLLKPLNDKVLHWRSLATLVDNFMEARTDDEGRMSCSFNICGTETYRFSSSENAFGVGMNLQNIPHKGSKSYLKALERGETFPNIKRMFVPDPGYTFFEIDLERADLHVVIWEADDKEMKAILREGADIHKENAALLGCNRELAKSWVHGTNYGAQAHTMSATCGITIATAEAMRKRWFAAHPGIAAWHGRIQDELRRPGPYPSVSNRFGYRRYYFDRPDTLFTKALAWVPQSTVACVINRAWVNIYDKMPTVQILLQVHDSLAGQYLTEHDTILHYPIRMNSLIPVPYPDPLTIPLTLKTSQKSWGECA